MHSLLAGEMGVRVARRRGAGSSAVVSAGSAILQIAAICAARASHRRRSSVERIGGDPHRVERGVPLEN